MACESQSGSMAAALQERSLMKSCRDGRLQWRVLVCLLTWCSLASGALVAAWPFDDGEGQTAHDASGNGNDGDIVRAAWSEGRSGLGLAFAGTSGDGYVEVADWETLQLTGKFTISFWWHKTSDTVQMYWFGQYHTMFLAPKSSPFYVASELRRMRRAGAQGFYFCGGGMCWGTEAPAYYVTSQLLRDPDLDENSILDELCEGLFAEAAPAMKEFFVRFLRAADRHYAFNPPVFEPGVPLKPERHPARDYFLVSFTEDVFSDCVASLRRAASATRHEAVHKRIRFFKDGFDYVRLTTDGLARLKDWQQQKSPEAKAALDATVAIRNRFVREMFERQMVAAGDLPLVFAASLDQLLYGPRGQFSKPFKTSGRAPPGAP